MSNNSWNNNSLQFARLLSEIQAIGLTDTQYEELSVSTGLSRGEINSLLKRAEVVFEGEKISIFGKNVCNTE